MEVPGDPQALLGDPAQRLRLARLISAAVCSRPPLSRCQAGDSAESDEQLGGAIDRTAEQGAGRKQDDDGYGEDKKPQPGAGGA